ncbi:phosphatidylglycerophosphatase and protein-tyrosine phosphatase 1-like [Paramacrobiotus metropolitanus]|uniref:phosphatidylglycerophosphatase and protein-tyrosine phosphatase 1-like n=1 Tax=Paramacrobiotus metropolitanus TaxID=2943436 RepID=UPI002445EA5A|nr:phosphatidylglycerophosphatase and protein-tyrosine phosphatase 1-like [Paramacrobiotus metropolitanus]
MGQFFEKVLFFPSLLATLVSDKMTNQNWYDRIDDCLVAGALPFRSTVKELIAKEGVRGVLSMNQNFELNRLWYPTPDELDSWGVSFLQLPVADYLAHPTWNQVEEGLDFIHHICSRNHSVYVHCKAGKFRSAVMAATYLMERYNLTPDEAKDTLRSHRRQVWLSAHWDTARVLQDFFEKIHAKYRPEVVSTTRDPIILQKYFDMADTGSSNTTFANDTSTDSVS